MSFPDMSRAKAQAALLAALAYPIAIRGNGTEGLPILRGRHAAVALFRAPPAQRRLEPSVDGLLPLTTAQDPLVWVRPRRRDLLPKFVGISAAHRYGRSQPRLQSGNLPAPHLCPVLPCLLGGLGHHTDLLLPLLRWSPPPLCTPFAGSDFAAARVARHRIAAGTHIHEHATNVRALLQAEGCGDEDRSARVHGESHRAHPSVAREITPRAHSLRERQRCGFGHGLTVRVLEIGPTPASQSS
mmetsp:Transcript_23676/g.68015  ORF Transcript_23676/g.68015 Transcript_23676/m.68015 type:complete len:242 (+) Transcript_23676:244-969(+)